MGRRYRTEYINTNQEKKRSGRAFGVGVYEEGEQAQIWTNDAVLKQHRAMAYTSKVIGQTASKNYVEEICSLRVDDGDILEHEDGKPITSLQLLPSGGLTQYQNLITQWYNQLEKLLPHMQPKEVKHLQVGNHFRLQALVLQQSSSVFDDLREDLGIFITEIFEDWILPFLAKKLNTEHILSHDFSAEELKKLTRILQLIPLINEQKKDFIRRDSDC